MVEDLVDIANLDANFIQQVILLSLEMDSIKSVRILPSFGLFSYPTRLVTFP